MHLPDFVLYEPAALEEASALLRKHGPQARVLAGGTDLMVDLKVGRLAARHVVSLGRIQGLRGITTPGANGHATKALRIGALTTLNELARSTVLTGPYAALGEAVREMASPQIRNLATIGGNIAGAVPCADLPPALLVLDATLSIWSSNGERTLPLRDFHTGPRRSVLGDGEILVAVSVPPAPSRFGSSYQRFALRDGNAIAVASAAASLTLDGNGVVQKAQLALGAVAPTIRLVPKASEALVGRRIDDESALSQAVQAAVAAAMPITDIRGSAEYRRELVGVLAKRALIAANERAKK